jgi:glycosyltransferase involved in cell wall biosynthesis
MVAPRVSVVIRSYNRIPALCELLASVLAQQFAEPFEVVVVEQSKSIDADGRARLAEFAADPRVRILRYPPLGGPRARNVGSRAARGEILLYMDDDDLPLGDGWMAAHIRHFADPHCLGVTGRHVTAIDDRAPRWSPARASRLVLSYVPVLMYQQCYNYVEVDRPVRVATVHGGNVSLRRSALARFGLWDECTRIEDEVSFNYRLRARKRPDEYLLYDPEALMLRRVDVPGGMNKRYMPVTSVGERVFEFLHNIVGHYFTPRFILLYPAYVVLLFGVCCGWVWGEIHGSGGVLRRIAIMLGLLLMLPVLWIHWTIRLLRSRGRFHGRRHEPRLEDPQPVPLGAGH